ncbi:hypothetical protein A4S05_24375 [Nostoc sp. KVJ20]|nr:hypothetical protein A4S05_24375 [Nostoc sp. KVJ20]
MWERQDKLLIALVISKYKEIEFIQFISDIVINFSYERRRSFIDCFIKHNKNFEDFEKLRLEPSSWGCSGSWVPVYQKRVEYLESLLPLFNSVDFLQHKQYVEQKIQLIRENIEIEKKRDFIQD